MCAFRVVWRVRNLKWLVEIKMRNRSEFVDFEKK